MTAKKSNTSTGKSSKSAKTKPKETAPEPVGTDLQDHVKAAPVLYKMNCGRLQIEPKTKVTMTDADSGEIIRASQGGFHIRASGSKRQTGEVGPFDPNDPQDAKIIDRIDKFIEEHPRRCAHIDVQLRKVNSDEVGVPVAGYANMTPEGLMKLVESGAEFSLEEAMRYELQRAELRDDMVEVLEKLSAAKNQRELDATKEVVL